MLDVASVPTQHPLPCPLRGPQQTGKSVGILLLMSGLVVDAYILQPAAAVARI